MSAGEVSKGETKEMTSWPEGWRKAYERFESFLRIQREFFPDSDLNVSSEGKISINPKWLQSDKSGESLTMTFYGSGTDFLEMGFTEKLLAEGRPRLFGDGSYAACLRTRGFLGYQYVLPVFRFAVSWSKETEVSGKESVARIRKIEVPAGEEERLWPNERLLYFWNFIIFPQENGFFPMEKNTKVSPDIRLWVSENGVITRNAVDAEAEKVLRWRIFKNGRLIGERSAKGELSTSISDGPGAYCVLVGVNGPNGFMPVSNFLMFPLFPREDGNTEMMPEARPDGIPKFLERVLTGEQLTSSLYGNSLSGRYARLNLYWVAFDDSFAEEDRRIVRIWMNWSNELGAVNQSVGNFRSWKTNPSTSR